MQHSRVAVAEHVGMEVVDLEDLLDALQRLDQHGLGVGRVLVSDDELALPLHALKNLLQRLYQGDGAVAGFGLGRLDRRRVRTVVEGGLLGDVDAVFLEVHIVPGQPQRFPAPKALIHHQRHKHPILLQQLGQLALHHQPFLLTQGTAFLFLDTGLGQLALRGIDRDVLFGSRFNPLD